MNDPELDQRTATERYRCLHRWLQYPHYTSVEDGEAAAASNLENGPFFFVVVDRGQYRIHRAYMQRDQVTSQNDFSFSRWDLLQLENEASREIGRELLTELE